MTLSFAVTPPTASPNGPAAALGGEPLAALQSGSLTADVTGAAAAVVGLSLVAGALAALVALLYRWYVRERVPGGLPILVGLSGVAVYLNSSRTLRNVITPTGSGDPLDETAALFNVVTFVVSLLAARAGTDVGDRIGGDVFAATGAKTVESEVSRVVQAVGRVITVEIPDEIDDIVGYDPVPDETKEALAGKVFVFPRRLTVGELRDRLVTRLKADYAVGHVDVDVADDGTVEYVALGSRAAGIGPTLPPETSAVAVRADPAFAASAGDLVQVWRTDPFERVLTAEVRGAVDDVVTLAVDAADTRKLDDVTEYRLVTLPVETRPDREFASVLRAADETMAAVTVAAGSHLVGQPVGALDVSVTAVRPSEGPVEPLPARDRLLTAGDSLYLVATPDAIRRVEDAAAESSDGPGTASSGSRRPPDRRVDATTPVAGGSRSAEDSTAPEAPTATDERATTDDAVAETATEELTTATAEATADETTADADRAADDGNETTDGSETTDDIAASGGNTGADASAGRADADRSGEGVDSPSSEEPVDSSDGSPTDAETPDSGDARTGDADAPVTAETDDAGVADDGDAAAAGDGDAAASGADDIDLGDPDLADLDTEGDEPTREDLADLPGTDVGDLTGATVDGPDESPVASDAREDGDGASEDGSADEDSDRGADETDADEIEDGDADAESPDGDTVGDPNDDEDDEDDGDSGDGADDADGGDDGDGGDGGDGADDADGAGRGDDSHDGDRGGGGGWTTAVDERE